MNKLLSIQLHFIILLPQFESRASFRIDLNNYNMANNLLNENSHYLRQHSDNPVDWQPWGNEAFQKAKENNIPVLVSIGYSSCHWCHVMAHESFENEYIANIMNDHFICIKVDREERPDIDQIYMEAVQMMNGNGGWPLNVFCLPDGRPFAGGTYFPPDPSSGHNIIPWPQLLMRISEFYKREQSKILENAESIVQNLSASNIPLTFDGQSLENEQLVVAAQKICSSHDDQFGGFGNEPKFPPSMALDFLIEIRSSAEIEFKQQKFASRIDFVINTTLENMAHGGIYDQLGGGFARYSVDRYWKIPHFEKMLYDNGLLLNIYLKAYFRYRNSLYQSVVEESIQWLEREMSSNTGGFSSSIDADSEGFEGKFYIWNQNELKEVLGKEGSRTFSEIYDISIDGNFMQGYSNPVLLTENIETRKKLKPLREKLFQVRQNRIKPNLDTKQLVSWNCLVINSLAEAGFYFGNKKWFELAIKSANWIWEKMKNNDDRLFSVQHDNNPCHNGYLNDYAFFVQALLTLASKSDWIVAGSSKSYIDKAQIIINKIQDHFSDSEENPGFYFTSDDHETLISRKKDWFDNAIPSANSVLVHCFSDLFALTGDSKYTKQLNLLRQAHHGMVDEIPSAIPHALAGYTINAIGIAVIKIKGIADLNPLQNALSVKPLRRTFLITTDDENQADGYQLCVGTECLAPTKNINELMELV